MDLKYLDRVSCNRSRILHLDTTKVLQHCDLPVIFSVVIRCYSVSGLVPASSA